MTRQIVMVNRALIQRSAKHFNTEVTVFTEVTLTTRASSLQGGPRDLRDPRVEMFYGTKPTIPDSRP